MTKLTLDGIQLPAPKSRELYFNKQVDQDSIGQLTKELLEINQHDQHLKNLFGAYGIVYTPNPIKIYIDSFGGSAYACLGIVGIMNTSTTPIHTYVTGVAMSAGFIIAIHGHKRFAYKHATFMYHQLSSGAWGKLIDMQESLEEAERLQKVLEDLTVKRTKISKATLKENFKTKKDWMMTTGVALKNGCVDEIL